MSSRLRTIAAVIGITAVLAVALTGCSSGPATGASSADATPTSVRGQTIVVYSPQGSDARGEYMVKRAKDDLGITVTFVSGGGGDLTNRLLAEKNNTQADVVLGLGEAQLTQVANAGILQPYTPSWTDDVPKNLRGSDKDFTLATQTPIVIAYNTAKMSAADAPKSWEDLAKPEYKNKFVFPSITGQTGQAAAVGILWRYTDHATGTVSQKGWDVLSKIEANSFAVSAGQKFDWNWVTSGAQPIVVSWLGGIQTGASDNKLELATVNTKGGSPYVQTGAGLVKGSSHAAAAKAFIDWFGSTNFQVDFVNATNNDTPVNSAAVKELGDKAAALHSIDKQDIDWSVVTKHLSDWLQKIQLSSGS
ncbi:iron(III) transport system substrate-binding protein [Leifsonia sp. 98AMF]|uniref:extracellular solute-binding protein n=1 Tax=unclassified Leifsonia TaxID=2663824 RepID=UPI00087C9034|nr:MULTISPECIES: extracellular solute-binding protein [unclassified Leifsonia]SDH61818.1 iron(III) transport system substrate-binding protein [Leifsonia sp. 197AMF]SDI77308.1 iron(III) transport system substrate-binding protein [Leifsonia sp. 466MF]SDK09579.1 iron(III) transport system substrate-binding protein [Leifsonia sp. 157MF]SDN80706.1 iron(III) transport system substrate-binding protein [Leifsonia sp. 509MF]SEN26699.1 iron(III) transport system substrate-binding protein [Leifsonia sp. 